MPPAGGESHTAAKRITKWHPQGAYLSPAQRCFITPEGGSPEPACQAKPITGRTLPAQGRQAQRLPQLERSEVGLFSSGEARLSGFRRQRRHKKWRPIGRPPSQSVERLKGRPPIGQARGQLRSTCVFHAEYAQSGTIYLPRAGARSPPVRRQPITGRTLGAQGQRPGGAINPHARKGVSTFGNTAARRK